MDSKSVLLIRWWFLLFGVISSLVLELHAQSGRYTIYQEVGGTLTICNNLVVNNVDASATNVSTVLENNILGENTTVLMDNQQDFTIKPGSVAVNAGDNTCVTWLNGMSREKRRQQNVVDIGAFEVYYKYEDTLFTIFQEMAGALTLCNNIIINNVADSLANVVSIPINNITGENTQVFTDNYLDFSIKPGSSAVNAGERLYVNWSYDMCREKRTQQDRVDIGAFETYYRHEDTLYLIYHEGVNTLSFCNNLIIINVADSLTNVTTMPANNITGEEISVFTDNYLDFGLKPGSIAVNSGEDECPIWGKDLRGLYRKWGVVDVGAYEAKSLIGAGYTVEQEDLGTLLLYNNIVIQNPGSIGACNINAVDSSINLLNDVGNVFVGNDDYSLGETSPAVNMGDNQYVVFSNDMKGESRIACEEPVDLGAYEVQALHNIQLTDVVCGVGQPYHRYGFDIDSVPAGETTFTRSVMSGLVCDSAYQLTLTVNPSYLFQAYASICENEAYVWSGHEHVTIGQLTAGYYIYWDSLTTHEGCDSVYQLNLTINPSYSDIFNDVICENEAYVWSGHEHVTIGQLAAGSYTFYDSLTTVNGCDSVVKLNLTVEPIANSSFDVISCGAFVWNNQWYMSSGSYQQIFTTANGCDSVVTMNLTIDVPARDTVFVTACGSYVWDGTTYTQSGTYAKVYPKSVGCDSIAIMILTIRQSAPSIYISSSSHELCDGGQVTLTASSMSGYDYLWNTGDTTRQITVSEPGTYSVQATSNGCIASSSVVVSAHEVCYPTPCPPPDPGTLLTGDTTTHYFNSLLFDEVVIVFDSLGNYMGVNSFKGDTLQIQCGRIYKFYVEANGIYEWNTDISYNVVPTYNDELLRTKITLFYDDFHTSAVVSDRAVNTLMPGVAAAGLSWRANYTGTVGVMVTRGDVSLDLEGDFCACNADSILLRYDMRKRPSDKYIVWGRYGTVRELPCDDDIHYIYDSGTNAMQNDAGGDYSNNEDGYLVLYPEDAHAKIKLWGVSRLGCGDTLFIYNGNIEEVPNLIPFDTITGPEIRNLGTEDAPLFMSSIPGEPITLRMKSDSTCTDTGFELQSKCIPCPGSESVSITATTVMDETCSGRITTLVASGGEWYEWSHSNETSDTVVVNPLVPTCYTVTAYRNGECAGSDTATICVDPSDVVENSMGSPSTSGQRFWVSFMRNYSGASSLSLLISAQSACTGTITNPNTGWSTSFSVAANQTRQISIPNAQAYCSSSGVVGNYGLLVTATDNISLYASNFQDYTYDVTNVLPEPALSTDYVVQTYTPLINSEFMIVATQNGTTVKITPSKTTSDNHSAFVPYMVTLNAGQTYQVLSRYSGANGDLSGSTIQSLDPSKPIAVFNGNVCANVPTENHWCDHVVEQAFGTHFWGRQFVVTNTKGMPYDVVKVTASADNTVLTKNGSYLTILHANGSYEFRLTAAEGACYLETSNASVVYLYIAGGEVNMHDNVRGDPSMVWISPLEQRIQEITFSTFNSTNITAHHVNVVVPTSSVYSVTCDGVSVANQFHPVSANSTYSYAQLRINNGTHTLNSSQGFVAHVYGTGHCETYAYSCGSKAALLSQQMYVNNVLSTELESNDFCTYEVISFDASVNYPCDSVVWNFGDSYQNYNGMHFTHHYTEGGTYPVSMTVFMYDSYGQHCTTIFSQMVIHDGDYVVYYDTVCQGDLYMAHGFDHVADVPGPETLTRIVDVPGLDCDSTYVTELYVLQRVFDYYDTICVGNDYTGYGFSLSNTVQGSHVLTDTVSRVSCDSISVLHLLVTPNVNDLYGIHGMEYVCPGGVYTYWLDTLSGLTDITWTMPTGAYLLSGQGTDHVEITFTDEAVEGNIAVTGTNSCGTAYFTWTVHPKPIYYMQITDTVCGEGQSYHRYGFDIDSVQAEHAVYAHNMLSEFCCDSTILLTLIVVDMPEVKILADEYTLCQNDTSELVAICESTDVIWSDTIYSNPPRYLWSTGDTTKTITYSSDTSSVVSVTITNAYGCSVSTDTVLTVYPLTNIRDTITICEDQLPLIYHDTMFEIETVSGEYVFRRGNDYGCDSLLTLHLIIKRSSHTSIVVEACEIYTWTSGNGQTYTSSGDYTYAHPDANGCTQVDTLHLTILESPDATITATSENICVGDEVTLQVTTVDSGALVLHVPPVAIGDILCTDNSIVKPSAWPVSGKTAMGIVFYVDNTGQHGWAVHLQDQGTSVRWTPYDLRTDIPTLANFSHPHNAITDMDGYSNTQNLRAAGDIALFPAAYAVDFANGWYLPAAGQLRLLVAEVFVMNNSLQIVNGTLFSMNTIWGYWSSTEADRRFAWQVNHLGNVTAIDKNSTSNTVVRSVRNF